MHSTLGMLLMVLSQEPRPAEVVTMFYDAMASRDGSTAISLVSRPMLDQMELMVELFQSTRSDAGFSGNAWSLLLCIEMDETGLVPGGLPLDSLYLLGHLHSVDEVTAETCKTCV